MNYSVSKKLFAVIIGGIFSSVIVTSSFADYRFLTLAGSAGSIGNLDGVVGRNARFNSPYGVATDISGNVYVADTGNHTIRKIAIATGEVTTIAGLAGVSGVSDSPNGANARFNSPYGVAVDDSGNVYVADTFNFTIRKITPAGEVSTLAGVAGVSGNSSSTDGTGATARFFVPFGLAVDGTGRNVYVADTGNNRICHITVATGEVTILAGSSSGISGSSDSTDGTGATAGFNQPFSVAVDAMDNVFVVDSSNNTIRKITSVGVVTTVAGSPGIAGSVDGIGSAALFKSPQGIAVDRAGNLFIADTGTVPPGTGNHTIRKITPAGVVTTEGGIAATSGHTDGVGASSLFSFPAGIALDSLGKVYVADTSNSTIRQGVRLVRNDFNQDGKTDILWRNTQTGEVIVWCMDDTALQSTLTIGSVTTDWSIAGTGDFTGNGHTDILWRKGSTGTIALWLMKGTSIQSTLVIATNITADWSIAGTGDFNGDGHADILWRQESTGAVALWLMNGTSIQSAPIIANITADWSIGGTGDFDGDGHTDILWRKESTGAVALWLMNGMSIQPTPVIANITADWSIAGTGDYNGDGQTDIIWRKAAVGKVALWLMNGTSIQSAPVIGNITEDWVTCN